MSQVPKQLKFQSRAINFAGNSRTPGGLLFVDHAQGQLIELFEAVIVRSGQHFSLARVEANPDLDTVRIEAAAFGGHPPLVGSRLLCGPLQFTPRPQATFVYPLNGTSGNGARAAAPKRERGVICDVAASGYGFIRTDAGTKVFVHMSQLEYGAQLLLGMRVSFERQISPKGPAAHFVRPAAN